MIVRRQLIPDIMNQRRDDQLIVRAITQRPGCGLQ